ncbi:hypothetical protein [Roseomonas sp. AR75]|jgi:hypothetical protein|uniref:hypothetical protein n=1 Tax=Roseomonas sp. AR75 TaxID=2562311 RepID=UPI0010C0AC11|nr:hypothetical protein [Roseomonas sp. AR75]
MLPNSHLAIVTRNITWEGPGDFATEPHECGWAREAMVFIRALKPPRFPQGAPKLAVQVGPDGMHWAPHGSEIALPASTEDMTALPLAQFGGWLRLAGTLRAGESITLLVSIHLKA